ncbi:MAG: TetR family transcriptional regulator [Desulfobacterales bacterium CG2_30_60_27]|nr:MAG: TetR family transcriptional regulator [Desulfobacterales bacterium CG2_30_60_27]
MRTADKHRKIIQAAIHVFAKKGFFNARISDIAKAAKVADGTIYLYFNNKYDILISLFEEEIGNLIEQVTGALQTITDPRKKLEIFALHHLGLVEENRELAEVLQVEIRQSNIFQNGYRNQKFAEYLDIIFAIIQEGQEQGLFRTDVNLNLMKRIYFGALDESSRLWIQSAEHDMSIAETALQICDLFLSGITRRA